MTKSTALYANNARTTLSADITTSSVSFTVGSAAAFPTITNTGDFFYVTLYDKVNIEVVKVTAVSSNTFTVTRAQDGTTAHAFLAATPTVVSHRLTAANIRNFARIDDHMGALTNISSLTAPSTMNGNSYVLGDVAADDISLTAVANVSSDIWTFSSYSSMIYTGTVTSATSTVINLTNASTILQDNSSQAYIVQFTTGTYKGQCRFVSSRNTTSFTVNNAFAAAPSAGDTYHVYQHVGSNATFRAQQQTALMDPVYVTPTFSFLPGDKRVTTGDVQQYNGTSWSTYVLNYAAVSATAPTTGTYSVAGSNGGFSGLVYTGSYHNQGLLVSTSAASSGVYRGSDSAWDWRWDAGVLAVGTVPYANVSGTPNLTVYAPIASPTFTGTPAAPTPATSTNTTQIATTAYVKAQRVSTGNATAGTRTDVSSGLIDQWFTSFQAAAGSGSVSITYPTAFANTAAPPRVTVVDPALPAAGSSNFLVATITSYSLTGCVINLGINGGGTRDVTLVIDVRGT